MEVLSSTIKEVFTLFTKEDWADLWKRLRYFTYSHYAWLPSKISGGLDLDDLIQDAIVDAVMGRRQWPPDVKLVTFLCQVIRSKVSHMLEKESSRLKFIEEISDPTSTSNQQYLPQSGDAHQQLTYDELCNKIRALVHDDTLLKNIVELWILDSKLKPSDIACMLGRPVEDIRIAQKRLSRKLWKLREEWPNV